MSALGNIHNLDLYVPKHPITRLSIPILLPEIPMAFSQLFSPPGTPQEQRAWASTWRRPGEHRVYSLSGIQVRIRIPKEWKTSWVFSLVSHFQRKQGVKAMTIRAVVFT